MRDKTVTPLRWILNQIPFLIIGLLITIALLMISAMCVYPVLIAVLDDMSRDRAWNEFEATPLPVEIAQDFCDRDLVPIEVADCGQNYPIIRNDQIPIILQSNLGPNSARDDVDDLIGAYKVACDARDSQSGVLHCRYRIGNYTVGVNYESENFSVVDMSWPQR